MATCGVHRYIAVEGPIGVGKTTLAERLAAALDADLLLEAPADNPFLADFYRDPEAYALPTQLEFLLARVEQLHRLRQRDLFERAVVADYLLAKDPLFAELTLERRELDLYRQVFRRLAGAVPAPDLVIYLQAPLGDLLERVSERGRSYEQGLDPGYLEAVSSAYGRFFLDYAQSTLLIVDTAHVDYARSSRDFEVLLERIATLVPDGGRHFFTPLPLGFDD